MAELITCKFHGRFLHAESTCPGCMNRAENEIGELRATELRERAETLNRVRHQVVRENDGLTVPRIEELVKLRFALEYPAMQAAQTAEEETDAERVAILSRLGAKHSRQLPDGFEYRYRWYTESTTYDGILRAALQIKDAMYGVLLTGESDRGFDLVLVPWRHAFAAYLERSVRVRVAPKDEPPTFDVRAGDERERLMQRRTPGRGSRDRDGDGRQSP